jgi:hypothetical protein
MSFRLKRIPARMARSGTPTTITSCMLESPLAPLLQPGRFLFDSLVIPVCLDPLCEH